MAKKKAPTVRNKNESSKFSDDIISNQIISKYGDIVESGEKVLESLQELKVISISPALDIALGGGIREGSVVVMTGDPKTGKTTTALYFASKAQELGKQIVYLNTEGRITKENLTGIKGLDPSKIKIVQTSEAMPQISAEVFLNTLERYVKGTPNLVAIIDSASNMVPQEELDGEVRTGIRNGLPRLLALFFKRISGDVAKNKAILIFITHNIANTNAKSAWAAAKLADCGNMIQYQAGTNMVITHRGKWIQGQASSDEGDEDANGIHVGQVANWVIKTSAAGGIPMSRAESWIRYGIGLDEAQELGQVASQLNFIKKNGAWYTISAAIDNAEEPVVKKIMKKNNIDPDDKEAVERLFKFQGFAGVTAFLSENPELVDFLSLKIKEVI